MDGATDDKGECPVMHGAKSEAGRSNRDWWPEQVDVQRLNQHVPRSNPMGASCDCATAFKSLDLDAAIADLRAPMTDSQGRPISAITAGLSSAGLA